MRTRWLFWVLLTSALASTAEARPRTTPGPEGIIYQPDLRGEGSDLARAATSAAFTAAQGGTTWFGGTVWAADSARWEAIQGGVWTFDSGVGSSIVPPAGPGALSAPTRDWIDPFKSPGLHATLEGWVGFDATYTTTPYFRRLASSDPRWSGGVCTGAPAGLGGTYSFWCGVFPEEAAAMCFAGSQGYGNNWIACIEHPFTYTGGGMTLQFAYRNDTEPDYDFSIVYVDTTGNGTEVEVESFTGETFGAANLPLVQGTHLPEVVPATIKLKFCVQTDGGWSDQDGLYPTACGAFAVDGISLTGGGISHTANFEASDNGWVLSPPKAGLGGEWASLYDLSDLPPIDTPCPCGLADSVLAFPNEQNGHNLFTDNLVASPWIDLKAAGLAGSPGKIIQHRLYADLPLLSYIYAYHQFQWYPEVCLNTGKLVTSPWTSYCFVYYYGGGLPSCTSTGPLSRDFGACISDGAEQVRVAVGLLSYCRFFANCTQMTNTTPWFDDIRVGVYGTPNAPFIALDEVDLPQDNFPENGMLHPNSPGRVDCNHIQGADQPEIGTSLGDTLVIHGATGGAEVYVHFRVTPGPGTNATAFTAWNNSHAASTHPDGVGFRMARSDSAEHGASGPISGNWMTAYHESDPNFSGSDTDIDAADVGPYGGQWRLANDIFPDDLFTMGTRIDMFFTANFVATPGVSYKTPVGASVYNEMEVLPSSVTPSLDWNCVLYVDHFGRGAQGYIESGLSQILGTGSENFESTNWDRFDVNAASSQQMSFGRPLQTEYGATIIQALAYPAILWNTGNLNAFNLTKEDADVLNPWLTLLDFDFNNLYLSGDGLVYSVLQSSASDLSALHLVEDLAGVTLRADCAGGSFRAANCPYPGAPADPTTCVNLLPVVDAVVAGSLGGRSIDHVGQGNGCPDFRAFDVLYTSAPDFGVSIGDERYSSPVKSARFASVSTDAGGAILNYKIVVDGLSVHYRRDAGTPCDFESGGANAVTERLEEVLGYFGHESQVICEDRGDHTGLEDSAPRGVMWQTALSAVSPNPLLAGTPGRIRFTLAREARASVEVYDVQGRLVKTIFDGVGTEGVNEAVWNGTDEAGTRVGSGTYFLRLQADGQEHSSRMVLLRGGGS